MVIGNTKQQSHKLIIMIISKYNLSIFHQVFCYGHYVNYAIFLQYFAPTPLALSNHYKTSIVLRSI